MRSLKRRLVVVVTVTVAAGFVLTAAIVWRIVSDAASREFDTRLSRALVELAQSADIGSDGILSLSREASDPAFVRPNSGWYWTIEKAGVILARSRSLRVGELQFSLNDVTPAGAQDASLSGRGPAGEPLQLRRRVVALRSVDLIVTVAGPAQMARNEAWSSMRALLAGLGVVAAILIVILVLEIEQGVRPLRRLTRDIEAASRGEGVSVVPPGYRELDPLAHSINDLIGQVQTVVERARAQAGNLAHAIRTPLSLISARNQRRGEAKDGDIELSVAVIQKQIDYHLKRARFAGRARLASDRVPVRPVIDDVVMIMQRSYAERDLAIKRRGDDSAEFLGEREDLEEIVGNLVENACKWAHHRVTIDADHPDGGLRLLIEDDGPGLPAEQRQRVLERGRRLDESVAGAGIGLAIVADLVALYGGQLDLHTGSSGGLAVEVRLPSPPTQTKTPPFPAGQSGRNSETD